MNAAQVETEVALAIYRTFSREPDPGRARKRWDRMKPAVRGYFMAEAKAAIETYRNLTTTTRRTGL